MWRNHADSHEDPPSRLFILVTGIDKPLDILKLIEPECITNRVNLGLVQSLIIASYQAESAFSLYGITGLLK